MKIRNQLFFIFLILGVTITLIISFLIFIRGKRIILNQIYANLEAVSLTKKLSLQEIIKNKLDEIEIISKVPLISNPIETTNHSNRSSLDSLFKTYVQSFPDFYRIYLINNDGKIINSSDSSMIGENYSNQESFMETQKKGIFFDDLFYNDHNELCITGGLAIEKGNNSNILLAEIKANEIINLTNDYTGIGITGETILIREYQQPVIINPTRFNPDAALKVKLPRNDPKYGINLALDGTEGIFENLLDYRNTEVIASTRLIESTHWGMFTKIDKAEAYYSINLLRNFLITLNLGFIVFAVIISYFMGRYIARPVEELIDSTSKMKEGDTNERIKYRYNNELRNISDSFNYMIDKLERKISEMEKMTHIVSHDLRAPLNSIIPLVDFIKEDNKGKLNKETDKMLDMIRTKSGQMNDQIKELLENNRIEKRIKENVDIDSLVSLIISNINPPAHIQIFIQHNLPIVYFHKISLMQVFQNLIHNAIKFMDKEKGIINIGFADEKNRYKFWITDNGPGIKEENKNKIFDPMDSSNNINNEGSTFGLGIAKKIIEENGGQIWLESDLGTGSTFYFTIIKA